MQKEFYNLIIFVYVYKEINLKKMKDIAVISLSEALFGSYCAYFVIVASNPPVCFHMCYIGLVLPQFAFAPCFAQFTRLGLCGSHRQGIPTPVGSFFVLEFDKYPFRACMNIPL